MQPLKMRRKKTTSSQSRLCQKKAGAVLYKSLARRPPFEGQMSVNGAAAWKALHNQRPTPASSWLGHFAFDVVASSCNATALLTKHISPKVKSRRSSSCRDTSFVPFQGRGTVAFPSCAISSYWMDYVSPLVSGCLYSRSPKLAAIRNPEALQALASGPNARTGLCISLPQASNKREVIQLLDLELCQN